MNLREAGVDHRGIDHSTTRHVYQYVETNLSQLAGARDTSQRSAPVYEESSSQKNQVSMKDWESLGNKTKGMYEFVITGTCMQGPASYEVPQPQEAVESDVFDRAGIYVPTVVSATLLLLVNYILSCAFFESVHLYM